MAYSFDMNALNNWITNNRRDLYVGLYNDATTLKMLINGNNAQINAKPGNHNFGMYQPTANIKERIAGCGRQVGAAQKLNNKQVTVHGLTDQDLFCDSTLFGTYQIWALANGMDPENGFVPEFAGKLIEGKRLSVQEKLEELIWKGDSALDPADPDYDETLAILDGFIKLIENAPTSVNLTVAGTTTVMERLTEAFLKMPTKVTAGSDFKIFVGTDMYNKYVVELMNKNIYNPTSSTLLFGTNAEIVPTPGLIGTDKFVMARTSDLIIATDLVSDVDFVKFEYSSEQRGYYMDMDFAIGVQLGYADQVGINK